MAGTYITAVLVLVLSCPAIFSQQEQTPDRILFRGVVQSSSSGERLAGSRFYINRSLTGISRDDGTFSFFASKRDTIRFDLMGYKESRFIIQDTLRSKEFLMGIFLQSDTIEIGEVVIIPDLAGLKADMMNPAKIADQKLDNARSNMTIASYQGRVSEGRLNDPSSNYGALRDQQKMNAFEKGGIPSSRIAGINPFMLIPAAAYLLIRGVPEKPLPPAQPLSQKELDQLNRKYVDMVKAGKK